MGIWADISGAGASRRAARQQTRAADASLAFQRESRDQQMALNEPWRQQGLSALGQLGNDQQFQFTPEEYQGPGAYQDKEFDFQADPGYQFRLQQGQQALERSAAARGGLFSGATARRLSDLSGQMASDEYGRARSRYEGDRAYGRGVYESDRGFGYGVFSDKQNARRQALNDRFSRLSTLAGFGEAATRRAGAAQGAFGQAAGDNAIQRGNAQAAGTVGAYNAQRDFLMGLGQLGMQGAGMAFGGPAGAAAAKAATGRLPAGSFQYQDYNTNA